MAEGALVNEQFRLTEEWFSLGLVTAESLVQMQDEWVSSGDHNPEHYRFGAFRSFLAANRPLSPEHAAALFDLGSSDEDPYMGGAMMADIVRLPECPPTVLDAAEATGLPFLLRLVRQRRGDGEP